MYKKILYWILVNSKFSVLVRKVNKGGAELVLLDHGLYQEVSQADRVALSCMWKAIVFNDHVNMKKYSNALGVESNYFGII